MRRLRPTFVLLLLAVAPGLAQPRIHLKTRELSPVPAGAAEASAPPRRLDQNRLHLVVQFRAAPQPRQLADLRRRGARVLQYIPDFGFLISLRVGAGLERLWPAYPVRMAPRDKISPLLKRSGPASSALVLAEFYPDVSQYDARKIVTMHGLEIVHRTGILPAHVLARGARDRIEELAEWDEVAYLFPAPEDMTGFEPFAACPGAYTVYGTVGQYAGRVSEGWDGLGRGSAQIGYFLSRLTAKLPAESVKSEILRGMQEWARYASVRFDPAAQPNLSRTLNVLFAPRNHGDWYPFDGPSGVLAHTYYPAPPNGEPLAGDMHFDDDESWVAGPDLSIYSIDLFSVALHELGHALGLAHSDQPGAVMFPYYRRAAGLTAEDVGRIQELYAAPDGQSLPPPTPPPAPPPGPSNPPSGSDTVAPSLSILSPAATAVLTKSAAMALSGVSSDNVGVVQVTWSTSAGASGVAAGTTAWSAAGVPLLVGTNQIVVRAFDAAGNSSWRSVTVTRK